MLPRTQILCIYLTFENLMIFYIKIKFTSVYQNIFKRNTLWRLSLNHLVLKTPQQHTHFEYCSNSFAHFSTFVFLTNNAECFAPPVCDPSQNATNCELLF